MEKGHILIVDDEASIVETLVGILRDEGFVVSYARDGNQALTLMHTQAPDLILLDIWLPGKDGIETLQTLKDMCAEVEVIMMSGHGNIETAVKATKLGAFDYIEKPLSLDSLMLTIHRALSRRWLEQPRGSIRFSPPRTYTLIGDSPQMNAVRRQLEEARICDTPVLIRGETGCEKEVVAGLLHKSSERREGALVMCHCAGLSAHTAERMLFGVIGDLESWERSPTRGYLELANGGSLFVHGIDVLQHELQRKLLHAMTSRMLQRVGGKVPIPLNLRLMASCTIPLGSLETPGNLLPDLAAQFRHLSIEIPPLRERKSDIPALADHFLQVLTTEQGYPPKPIDDDAMAILCQYDWPGNVEELKHIIEQMVITGAASRLGHQDVTRVMQDGNAHHPDWKLARPVPHVDARRDRERMLPTSHRPPRNACRQDTARLLHMPERHWWRKIAAHPAIHPAVHSLQQQKQKTLRRSMVLYGQGLQSGLKTGIILCPLPPHSGIVFSNITTGETLSASIEFVDSTDFSTSLRKGRVAARTVEHLMSALHAYGICNLLIKISHEVPIMDGSAAAFCQLIEDGGIEEQEAVAEEFVVDRCYHISALSSDAKSLLVEPYDGFRVTYRLDYPQPLGVQEFTYEHQDGTSYRCNIAPARTFAFVKEVEKMHDVGLGAGGRLNNVILLDDEKIVNSVQLRFPDEYARHKVLDIIGDLYLLGKTIRGHVRANMTGHTENVALVRKLHAMGESW